MNRDYNDNMSTRDIKENAMTTSRRTTLMALAGYALAALVGFATPRLALAADSAITADNVIEKVGQANTKADHEALAIYFHSAAKEKSADATRHEAMLKSWGHDAGRPKENMRIHCQTLINSYASEAKALEALAKEHEKLAK